MIPLKEPYLGTWTLKGSAVRAAVVSFETLASSLQQDSVVLSREWGNGSLHCRVPVYKGSIRVLYGYYQGLGFRG